MYEFLAATAGENASHKGVAVENILMMINQHY